jgi:hypothetical protein
MRVFVQIKRRANYKAGPLALPGSSVNPTEAR